MKSVHGPDTGSQSEWKADVAVLRPSQPTGALMPHLICSMANAGAFKMSGENKQTNKNQMGWQREK